MNLSKPNPIHQDHRSHFKAGKRRQCLFPIGCVAQDSPFLGHGNLYASEIFYGRMHTAQVSYRNRSLLILDEQVKMTNRQSLPGNMNYAFDCYTTLGQQIPTTYP